MNKEELRDKYQECARELFLKKQAQTHLSMVNIAYASAEEMLKIANMCAKNDLDIEELQTKMNCYQKLIRKLVESEMDGE